MLGQGHQPPNPAMVPRSACNWLTVSGSGHAIASRDAKGRVTRLDVSLDEGRSWRQAELGRELSPWAWRRWALTVDAARGPLTITARAWDSTGATQPESAAALWNPKGYANNSWARVQVDVR